MSLRPRSGPNLGTPVVEQGVVTDPTSGVAVQIRLDTPEWFRWLASIGHFYVIHPVGNFFCHLDYGGKNARGDGYWIAHRRANKRKARAYLGKDENVTAAALDRVAQVLAARLNGVDAVPPEPAAPAPSPAGGGAQE